MLSLSSYESLRWLILAISGYIVYTFLYPFLFSPMRHLPGPWYARVSKLWIIYKTVQGVRARSIHDLHRKFGQWVVIGPDEVSTSDQDAIVPIYGATSKFCKTTFYTYQLRGIPELFTMSSQKQHADRRRLLAHLFSMSTMKDYEPVISDNVKLCMSQIAEQGCPGQASNLYDWFHYLSMDIICELCFGRTFNMLREGMNSTYIQDMYQSLEIEPVRYHFGFLNRYAGWAPLKWVRESEAASVRSFAKGIRMVQEYKQNPEKKRAKDLLRKMLDARDEAGNALPEDELNVEAVGLILAGSHTTSSSLTWIVWRLLRHPDILSRLVKELDDALLQCPRVAVPPHHYLEHLTYFNAVIKEGLRIDTAVPGSTPRYVPHGGADISGHYLPGGATVSIQAYSTHRDSDVFPDPDIFDPDRWVSETPEMRRMYIPFGADGPRKCIGIHLAYVELRVILASLLHRFELSLIEQEDTDKAMDMHELWLAAPEGQRLLVFAKERPPKV
ncbi:cytochrome P450 [Exophiala viscosa]|uniref:cytochrome P450 n=1 Tax=Exophiala viscosa TaxID=2486360 RepID=UPI0021969215|nr:cytochrome P450 [Exophiala viscosa]